MSKALVTIRTSTLTAAKTSAMTALGRRSETLQVLNFFLHAGIELLRLVVVFDIMDLVKEVWIIDAEHLILK